MRFGRCADCKEYKYLKNKGKCSSCLRFSIDVYRIQGEEIAEAMKAANNDENYTPPGSRSSNYDNLFEELIDYSIIDKRGIRVTDGVYRSIKKGIEQYKSKVNQKNTPKLSKAIKKLENASPVNSLTVDNSL